MADPSEVKDEAGHRFVLEVDGHEAELVYKLNGDRLTLIHTGVPDELGGRGLGGVLVRAAIDRASAEGLTVVPVCPFARSWLEKHPDQAARVTVVDPKA
jgi:predicted GNAT family acetyltransferase